MIEPCVCVESVAFGAHVDGLSLLGGGQFPDRIDVRPLDDRGLKQCLAACALDQLGTPRSLSGFLDLNFCESATAALALYPGILINPSATCIVNDPGQFSSPYPRTRGLAGR